MSGLNSGTAVLVVEDDDGVRGLLVDFLEDAGYQVCATADARAAREVLNQSIPFTAMITDNNMPGELGASLAIYVRRTFPEMAVLLVTGKGRPEDLGNLQIPVLEKPFRSHELLAALRAELVAFTKH
jgi:DNA-binding response OmpR family regulator